MKTIITIAALLLGHFLIAQSIQGKLIDSQGNEMPYATLQLLKSDSSIHKIEMSKSDGSFKFENLNPKAYYLSISFIGYQTINKKIDLSTENGVLGPIKLEKQSTELGEVVVAEEKPMIEVEPDKTVLNVSKSLSSAGEDGVELLRKAPGLQIDNNDNIIMEGKSGITIYVNGKQSYLSGQDLTNYLKSIKAEEIESVEIITQPSSKYDAAGSGGILNIILKREKGLGTKGSITNTLTVGSYVRNNTTVNINHRTKKMALFGTLSHFEGERDNFFFLKRVQGPNIFDGRTITVSEMNNDRINVGGDYYLNSKSTFGASFSANLNEDISVTDSKTPISQTDDFIVDSVLSAPNRNNREVQNLTANINYNFKDTNGVEFSADLDWVKYNSEVDSYQPNIYISPDGGEVFSTNINFQDTPIEIDVISGKVDYEQKAGKKSTVAFGAKVSQVITNNVFDFFQEENSIRTLDSSRSNLFDYEERILAAYINYNTSWKKWKFQGGLRGEQTFSDGDLESFVVNADSIVKREYFNLFPSAGLTYQINRNNKASIIYSRRIQRPNYQNLNPFESQINELSFRKGNPFLQPQFTDNIKISNIYKYTLNTSLTYSYVSDFFAEVTEADDEDDRKSFINTRNVADQQIYNLSVSYPFKINKWWSVYASSYIYYTKFTANNPAFIPIDRIVYGGYGQSTFKLPKNYKFELSGWYSSPSIWRGTFRTESIGALNMAVQKTWKNWTAKLSFNDIFYTIPWRAENEFGNLRISGTGGSDSRTFVAFLSYSFGQKDVKEKRKRNTGSEEEQKRLN